MVNIYVHRRADKHEADGRPKGTGRELRQIEMVQAMQAKNRAKVVLGHNAE